MGLEPKAGMQIMNKLFGICFLCKQRKRIGARAKNLFFWGLELHQLDAARKTFVDQTNHFCIGKLFS
jgi:hypothetical protein